jgi:hypothetical protein
MTKQNFIEKWIGWVSNREELKNEMETDLEAVSQALRAPDVVGQSERLKEEVFTLANKLAVAGEGEAAVAMHRIHNSIAIEYAEFCVRCDREKLPLLCLEDYIKQYCR